VWTADRCARDSGAVLAGLRPAAPFYEAEAYHQAYAKKNPVRYRVYRASCRRDARLREPRGPPGAAPNGGRRGAAGAG
jgi:peptide-methionine (S)-S-oxide reductase